MVKKYRIHLYIVVIGLILTPACSRQDSTISPQQTPAVVGTAGVVGETAVPTDLPQPTATEASGQVTSQPVPFFSGLASLDSYQSTTRIYSTGPGPNTLSETISEVQFNRATDATRNLMTSKSSDEDNPSPETTKQEQITIDLERCELEDDVWTYNQMEPQEKEVFSVLSNLYDIVPVISNPVFVAAETKNGIATNHFTFEVQSAGAESGSVVTANQGEYWIAVDGQYLVAYSLHYQLRSAPESDPEAEVNTLEIEYSLENVNQPIDIQLPADCAP